MIYFNGVEMMMNEIAILNMETTALINRKADIVREIRNKEYELSELNTSVKSINETISKIIKMKYMVV